MPSSVVITSLTDLSQTFVHALYHLAANPEYIQPLREEAETVLREEGGWSKAALGRMIKIDSFFKESQRVNGVSASEHSPLRIRLAIDQPTFQFRSSGGP